MAWRPRRPPIVGVGQPSCRELPSHLQSFGPRLSPEEWRAVRAGSPHAGLGTLFDTDIRQHQEVPLCAGLGANVGPDEPFRPVRRMQLKDA